MLKQIDLAEVYLKEFYYEFGEAQPISFFNNKRVKCSNYGSIFIAGNFKEKFIEIDNNIEGIIFVDEPSYLFVDETNKNEYNVFEIKVKTTNSLRNTFKLNSKVFDCYNSNIYLLTSDSRKIIKGFYEIILGFKNIGIAYFLSGIEENNNTFE